MTHDNRALRTPRPPRRSAIVLLSALTLAGCADKEAQSEKATASVAAASPTEAANDDARAYDNQPRADEDAPVVERKLIQTAELHMQVSSYAAARSRIEDDLRKLGGFIANAQVEHADGEVSYANLTIRVPSDKLADFLAGTAGHGDVTHETLSSQDITEGYYDLEARIKNATRLEARLLALLDNQGDSVTSLLEVERELARVRGQIEGFEGKLRLWDSQVSLSTVQLRLASKQVYAVHAPPTLGEKLNDTLGGSFGALKGFGLGILVVLVALIPWLIPLALAGWALRALVRSVRRRRPAAPFVAPQGPVAGV